MPRRGLTRADFDTILEATDALLAPHGFARDAESVIPIYFRFIRDAGIASRIEGLSLRFEYGFRTNWLWATVKFPELLILLSEVRPFTYLRTHAWTAPDYASHVAARVSLEQLGAVQGFDPPAGIRWGADGRLRRARSVAAETLGSVMEELVRTYALPAFGELLSLPGIARAADHPDYAGSGIGGAWSLAARIALGDLPGAAQAFRTNPYCLGLDRKRFESGKSWLLGKGIGVADVQ